MGKCCNCNRQIKLKEGLTKCPACGEDAYKCWNCHELITAKNECPACGFYVCVKCKECGLDCPIDIYPKLICTDEPSWDIKLVTAILKKYYELKLNNESNRRICPKGVPSSYAKSKLRNYLLKISGKTTKDAEETALFRKRFANITQKDVGYTYTISQTKEKGFYGQEYRDASYYGVCMGALKINRKPRLNSKKEVIGHYDEFERIPMSPNSICDKSNDKRIAVKLCKKCKRCFDISKEYCPDCLDHKKGNEEHIQLKVADSHCEFCQLPRKEFIKRRSDTD